MESLRVRNSWVCLFYIHSIGEFPLILERWISLSLFPCSDRFDYFRRHNHEYFTVVIDDLKKGRIAAAGTVMIERKFIHEAGLVGHIEDIVSHPNYRGKNMGR